MSIGGRSRVHFMTNVLAILSIPRVVGMACACGVVYALWMIWSTTDLAPVAWQLRPLPLIGGLLLMLVVTFASVLCWLVSFRQLGGKLSVRDAFQISLVTNLGKYLPGKVMHVASRVAMLQAKDQPMAISIASIAVDVGLSLLAAALVSLFGVPMLLGAYDPIDDLNVVIVAWLAVVAVGAIVLHPRVVRWGLEISTRVLPGAGAARAAPVPSYAAIVPILSARVGLWLLMALALFLTARTVHPLDWSWLPAMGGVAGLSYLFGLAVPIAPSGIGAREGLMTLLLATVMPAPEAAATSVLFRIVSILAEALAAGAVMLTRSGRRDPVPTAARTAREDRPSP